MIDNREKSEHMLDLILHVIGLKKISAYSKQYVLATSNMRHAEIENYALCIYFSCHVTTLSFATFELLVLLLHMSLR